MKKISSLQFFIFSCVIIMTVYSCKKEKILLPTLTTTSVSNITETTAQSGGNVTNDGNDIVGSRGIVWSKSSQPTLEANTGYGIGGTGLGIFTIDMTGLEGNTNYYVRAFASNKAGTIYGNQQEFKTLLIEKANILTEVAIDITTTTAIIGGNVQTDGGSVVFERGIFWSTSQNPETTGTKVQIGNGTGAFHFNSPIFRSVLYIMLRLMPLTQKE